MITKNQRPSRNNSPILTRGLVAGVGFYLTKITQCLRPTRTINNYLCSAVKPLAKVFAIKAKPTVLSCDSIGEKMTVNWYAHHLGDYRKKTASLSMLEHGAYRILIDECYLQEGKLPVDKKSLYRVCGALNQKERRAVDAILNRFFILGQHGFYTQKRILEEIKKRGEISEKRRNASAIAHANGITKGRPPTTNNQQPQPATNTESDKSDSVIKNRKTKNGEKNGKSKNKSWAKRAEDLVK